jgi:hypothetical protein
MGGRLKERAGAKGPRRAADGSRPSCVPGRCRGPSPPLGHIAAQAALPSGRGKRLGWAWGGVAFSFPTEYLLEHGPARLRALALDISRELPFSFGYASLAFVCPSGLWYAVRRELLGPLSRYLGLDLYQLEETSRVIGTRARGGLLAHLPGTAAAGPTRRR